MDFKPCDWSKQFSMVILLVLKFLKLPTSTVARLAPKSTIRVYKVLDRNSLRHKQEDGRKKIIKLGAAKMLSNKSAIKLGGGWLKIVYHLSP